MREAMGYVAPPASAPAPSQTPAAILRRAAERVRRGWTQKVHARTADGKQRMWDAPDAVSWCAYGAIRAEAIGEITANEARLALARRVNPDMDAVAPWNDRPERTAEDVAATMDAVAAELEAATHTEAT